MVVIERTNRYSVPDSNGNFAIQPCPPGDHTLNVIKNGTIVARKFIRLSFNQKLKLGMLIEMDERQMYCHHYDGYNFGWIDENEDGINDNFMDYNGDGICDISGDAYCHGYGWVDDDEDGINDNFADEDGDGKNDINGMNYYKSPKVNW